MKGKFHAKIILKIQGSDDPLSWVTDKRKFNSWEKAMKFITDSSAQNYDDCGDPEDYAKCGRHVKKNGYYSGPYIKASIKLALRGLALPANQMLVFNSPVWAPSSIPKGIPGGGLCLPLTHGDLCATILVKDGTSELLSKVVDVDFHNFVKRVKSISNYYLSLYDADTDITRDMLSDMKNISNTYGENISLPLKIYV